MHHKKSSNLKLFDKLFQHHEQQQLQEVGTKATGPGSTFAKQLAARKTAAEEEVYGAVNMTADKSVEFPIRLSNGGTETTTCSLADIDRIVSHLERDLWYHIEWADVAQEGIIYSFDRIWSLVAGNWHSAAVENY